MKTVKTDKKLPPILTEIKANPRREKRNKVID